MKTIQRILGWCQKDVQRMSGGCPEGNKRGTKDLYRMVLGCIENAYIHLYGQKSQWFRPDCCFADRWYPETMSIYIVELCLRMSQQGQQEYVYKGCPLYIYFLSKQNLTQLTKYQQSCTYRKVASRSTSRLVARPRIFWLLMKGKFDPYVLWSLAWDLWPLNSRPVYCSLLYGKSFLSQLLNNRQTEITLNPTKV